MFLPKALHWKEHLYEASNIRQKLKISSLEDIIADQVKKIREWDTIEDPVAQRFARNNNIIFSEDELTTYYRMRIRELLTRSDRQVIFEE